MEAEAEDFINNTLAVKRVSELKAILDDVLPRDLSATPTVAENSHENVQVITFGKILSEYQEYSFLLDPHWEQLVVPVIEILRDQVRKQRTGTSKQLNVDRTDRLTSLIYKCIKCRGYKTIVRYFPHTTSDLSIILSFCTDLFNPYPLERMWTLRYIMLLWLSLVCMIPFDLQRFNAGTFKASERIEILALDALPKAGLEREAGALVLARLYSRKDTKDMLSAFLTKLSSSLVDDKDIFWVLGHLRVILHLTTTLEHGPDSLLRTTIDGIVNKLEECPTLLASPIVRKYKVKLESRNATSLLKKRHRRLARGKRLGTTAQDSEDGDDISEEDDDDVPEDIENAIDVLLPELEDKDTTVRWSAAKGLAGLSERLPSYLSSQILSAILRIFSIYSSNLNDSELPAVAEASWHGACLAAAEMARRGLVREQNLEELVGCLSRALFFDIRKGSHSIGSSVRDAACYVIWSLVRSTPSEYLRPYASGIEQDLITVSVLDREVHIRRAASAAYQEAVGRTSLFLHGIEILKKTDFHSVGIRRNAYIVVAPDVAQYPGIENALLKHLLNTTIKHWDVEVRMLGAKSLREIIATDKFSLAPSIVEQIKNLLTSKDNNEIHGALVYLAEVADGLKEAMPELPPPLKKLRAKIFSSLRNLPPNFIQKYRHELIMEAVCAVISNAIEPSLASTLESTDTLDWKHILDTALRHRVTNVQETASSAYRVHSGFTDFTALLKRFQRELETGDPSLQRSMAQAIGMLRYDTMPQLSPPAIGSLTRMLEKKEKEYVRSVEVRKASVEALTRIVTTLGDRVVEIDPSTVCGVIELFIDNLEDYSVDQRGDVGSWVRMSCVSGLVSVSGVILGNLSLPSRLESYLPSDSFHRAVGGVLKQGVERLDNVRQLVGEEITRLMNHTRLLSNEFAPWKVHGMELLKPLESGTSAKHGWREGTWLYPHAVKLLNISQYRHQLLLGLILSIGSRTSATYRSASEALQSWIEEPPRSNPRESTLDFLSLLRETFDIYVAAGTRHNMDIAALRTLELLLKCDSARQLIDNSEDTMLLGNIVERLTKVLPKLKGPERIQAIMKVAMTLLPFPEVGEKTLPLLSSLLSHHFPKVRAETSEALFIVLETEDFEFDTEELTDLLSSIEWTEEDVVKEVTQKIIDYLTKAYRRCLGTAGI